MTQRIVRGPCWRAEWTRKTAPGLAPGPLLERRVCPHCAERERLADELRHGPGDGRGKQLGQLERRVLLMSAPWQREHGAWMLEPRVPLLAAGSTTSAQTGLRAAASRVCAAGLISLRRGTLLDADTFLRNTYVGGGRDLPVPGQVDPLRRRLAHARWSRRTLLGEGFVILYRDVLETPGRRLRWDSRLDQALLGVRLRCLCRRARPFDPDRDFYGDLSMPTECPGW